MGGSYGNLLVLGSSLDELAQRLTEPAYVIGFDDAIAVCSEHAAVDTETAAIDLSAMVDADVLGFFNFDDDVLAAVICRSGEALAQVQVPTIEEYAGISFDELELMAEVMGEPAPGAGNVSDASAFVRAVGRGDMARALNALAEDDDEFVGAADRHRELMLAFGLPAVMAGWDFFEFEGGTSVFKGPTPTRVGF